MYVDATNIRLRELSLAYQLPTPWVGKTKVLKKVRLDQCDVDSHTYEYIFPQIYQSENAMRNSMPAFFAITKILKAEVMHRVTDYYGPIIYSRFANPDAKYIPDAQ